MKRIIMVLLMLMLCICIAVAEKTTDDYYETVEEFDIQFVPMEGYDLAFMAHEYNESGTADKHGVDSVFYGKDWVARHDFTGATGGYEIFSTTIEYTGTYKEDKKGIVLQLSGTVYEQLYVYSTREATTNVFDFEYTEMYRKPKEGKKKQESYIPITTERYPIYNDNVELVGAVRIPYSILLL